MPVHHTFHSELEKLNQKLLTMVAMVEDRVRKAVTVIETHDEELVKSIIRSDYQIDDMEVEIEEDCLKIMALHQPVASDLRFLITVIKVNNEIERIGDMAVNIAKQWVRDLTGANFTSGRIKKESLPHHNNAGMQGFVMNLRRPLFQDRRVRQALNLAFDFEWTNQSLFFDQYTQSSSYFSNSDRAPTGLPTGLELEYLAPFREQLPAEVFTTPPTPVSSKGPGGSRQNLAQAKSLLEGAGYTVKDNVLVNREGQPLAFEILLVSSSFERVIEPYVKNLQRLGIKATYRTIDPALYTLRVKDFAFDMVVNVYGQSQSPGNEQRDYWHSSVADRPGSRNLMGLHDPAVDQLVDRIIYASRGEELTAACRALDRVLWYGYYLVPNWYVGSHRLAYWDRFAKPETLPRYYQADQALMTWWMKGEAETR